MYPNQLEIQKAVAKLDGDPSFARKGREMFGGTNNRETVEKALQYARAKAAQIKAENTAMRAKVEAARARVAILELGKAGRPQHAAQATVSPSYAPPSRSTVGGAKSNGIPSWIPLFGAYKSSSEKKPAPTPPSPPSRYADDSDDALVLIVRKGYAKGSELEAIKCELSRRGVTIHKHGFSKSTKPNH